MHDRTFWFSIGLAVPYCFLSLKPLGLILQPGSNRLIEIHSMTLVDPNHLVLDGVIGGGLREQRFIL
jgi:hypothetical protein